MVEYKKHELRTHILDQSPEMYVGSISPEAISSFIVDDENKIVRKTINYSPALYKIFDELIVNAADHVVRMNLSNLTDKQIVKNQIQQWSYKNIQQLIFNINEIELLIKKNSLISLSVLFNFIIEQVTITSN